MAKRFTDTGKWNKPFIRGMKAPYKLLWLFILDECDHAGIWQVDIHAAELKTGEKIKKETAIDFFKGKISIVDNGEKWFIPDFIEFQYGELNPLNRVHESILKILKKYNLIDNENIIIKPLTSPLQGAMDKDKDKDMDKDKEKGASENFKIPTIEVFLQFSRESCSRAKMDFDKLQFSIISKYEQWKAAGWKDGFDKPITNWKTKFNSTLPSLKQINTPQKPSIKHNQPQDYILDNGNLPN